MQGCGIAKFFRDSDSGSDSMVRDSDSTFKIFAIPIPIPLTNFRDSDSTKNCQF